MEGSIIVSQMVQMFLMMFLGYFLRKIGLMDQGFTAKLTTFLLNVAMPCLILHSVIGQAGGRNLEEAGVVFAVAIGMYLLLPLLSLLVVKLLRLPKQQQGVYAFTLPTGVRWFTSGIWSITVSSAVPCWPRTAAPAKS